MGIKKYDLYVYQKANGAVRIYGKYIDINDFIDCFIEYDNSIPGSYWVELYRNLIRKRKRKSKRDYFVDMDELYAARLNLRNVRKLKHWVYNLYMEFFGVKNA